MLEDYVYPRQTSLAERAWAPRPAWPACADLDDYDRGVQGAWNEFANWLGQRELPRLDHLFGGTAYRLPLPDAVIRYGKLEVNTEYPGLAIRYTTNLSAPSATSSLYTGPVAVTGTVKLSTFDTKVREPGDDGSLVAAWKDGPSLYQFRFRRDRPGRAFGTIEAGT